MHLSNPWFVLLLASLAGLHLLEVVASLLNLKRLQPSLPEEFSGVFSAEDYARSQQYTRESERFGLITGTVRLFVFLAFWLAGGFGWLDTLVRSLASSEITQGLLGFSFLYLASSLLSLPFEIHDTFRIEAKYGFNKTTPGTFAADHLKGLALAALVRADEWETIRGCRLMENESNDGRTARISARCSSLAVWRVPSVNGAHRPVIFCCTHNI
jgi:STE24 endopeptidase